MKAKKRGRRALLPGSILELFKLGRQPLQISQQLGCSFSLVYRVLRANSHALGFSHQKPGRKTTFDERIQQIVLKCRADNPTSSGRMIRFFLA